MMTETRPTDAFRGRCFDPVAGWIGLVCLVVIVAAVRFIGLSSTDSPPPAQNQFRVDVNRATEAELMALPNVGPATADKIVKYRQQNGPFADVNQLLRVPGIGPETLKSLRPLLIVPGEPADDSLVRR